MAEPLEVELATYNELLPSLLKDEGKFALIIGKELVGIYGTYEDALKVGYDRAALKPFLVKKISGAETVAYFSRDLGAPCHI
jgi:hypothetical protein